MRISDFGIILSEEEVRKMTVDYLKENGYLIKPENISIVPLTNSKIEFVIKPFKPIAT